jgi:hypothetical protein
MGHGAWGMGHGHGASSEYGHRHRQTPQQWRGAYIYSLANEGGNLAEKALESNRALLESRVSDAHLKQIGRRELESETIPHLQMTVEMSINDDIINSRDDSP